MEGIIEDMWSPYKYLHRSIEQTLNNPTAGSINELEMCLKKYKQTFTSLLRNPPKNERNRNQIRNGITEGITFSGHSRTILLSKDLVDECIVISDMYNLDEFIALELLCTAQRQMPQHPGLTRGLVAILLYYDGKKAIANSLRDLFQVTSGVSWITDIPKELTYTVSSFTQSIVHDSFILERIIELLDELDISKETLLLTKNRALGTKKHQSQVFELFEEIRLALATAVFNWSAQRGLNKSVVLKLIQSLSKYQPTEASGSIDDVTLTLLMALLYSYDTSVLLRQEDNNTLVQSLPVMSENDFTQSVYEALISNNYFEHNNYLGSIAKFAFALSLASLRHAPQTLQNSLSKTIEHDEQLLDDAIANKIFDIMYYYILDKDIIYKSEFFYRRIHILFTDFIDFMHSKVTELRGRADETARIVVSFSKEGLEPPSNLDHSFEMLLLCIGKFYNDNKANLSLCVEYWGSLDATNYSKSTSRSVSLFKFIRLAGELLPSTLFVPYLKMIAGLTSCERSARNAFNLLKQASGLSGSATLSWEHFFGSLTRYYSNLRQEQSTASDAIYRNRLLNRSINPQELEGLHAVLGVIRAVANYDEVARIAICEHPNWAPLNVLLGLLCCSVPLSLKADILKTLAALGKSRETAIPLWNNLEVSQIITTIPTINAYHTCNLEMEIDQNESRNEVYPVSKSILELFHALVTTGIPKNLGSGLRKPGFDPYLTFIMNGIFLKFYNRVYKNWEEKWQVGNKCLKLLHYLLRSYEVTPTDFDENNDQNPHPGFHIMLQLHTKSDMLRLILLIIDDVRNRMDEYTKFHGKAILEECAQHCLNILECGLAKQDVFFDAHSVANSSILLSGLNKIILDVNPRSGKPDHILNTTKFITYNSWLPNHTLAAVKILKMVSRLPNIAFQILGMFTENDSTESEIRQGFVECLESELSWSSTTYDVSIGSVRNSKIELEIKNEIIELLQDCLLQPQPNITHFLLGFDLMKDNYMMQNNRISINDNTINCTKSLLLLLDNHLEAMKSLDIYDADIERIIERAYALLYSLCSNPKTSDTILRYLRSCNDLLCRHLTALPFKNMDRSHVLNQMSHLLKCIALEVKTTALNCQISRFQNLCDLLVGTSTKTNNDTIPMELSHYYNHSPTNFGDGILNKVTLKNTRKLLLCHMLDCLTFEIKTQPVPKWNYFDNTLTKQIFQTCEIKAEHGFKLINIAKLHEILNDELHAVQSTIAGGQRKLIMEEIESVMVFALEVNDERKKNFATIKLVESWGQVTEMLFTCAPDAAMSFAVRQELILEIVQKILRKVVSVEPIFELSILMSGTILLLLVNLKYYSKIGNTQASKNDHIRIQTAQTKTLSLKYIFKSILEWIIVSGVGSQKLRINLYAVLLNCLSLSKGCNDDQSNDESREFYVSRLDKSMSSDKMLYVESNHVRMFVDVFLSFGDKIIDTLCHDAIAGHNICKMSALSCIDVLLDLDYMSGFIYYINNHGYLLHIIESLMKFDESLCRVLYNTPDDMKSLYVYESKMAMLLRLASFHMGAEMLLSNKTLGILSNMKVYNIHPDIQSNNFFNKDRINAFVPPVDARFRQILLPALNLCDCLISTLGSENHSVLSQVMSFLLSHGDMVEIVLRNGSPFVDLGLLQELTSITNLIARTTNQELFALGESVLSQEGGVNLYRVHRLMISLFTRFIINDNTFKEMLKTEKINYEPTDSNKALHVKYFLEIASNLSLYCRNAVANHGADHRTNGIIFSPNITDSVLRGDNKTNSINLTHSISLVLNQLKGSVEYFISQKSLVDNYRRQISTLPNITFDSNAKSTHFELTQRHNDKKNELSHCSFITEQCLYLLWSHLDFYMRRALGTGLTNANILLSNTNNDQGVFSTGTVCLDDVNHLKKYLISVFNETFCKQLLSTSESGSEVDKSFNEALLRRIKSLIQFVPACS